MKKLKDYNIEILNKKNSKFNTFSRYYNLFVILPTLIFLSFNYYIVENSITYLINNYLNILLIDNPMFSICFYIFIMIGFVILCSPLVISQDCYIKDYERIIKILNKKNIINSKKILKQNISASNLFLK